MQGHLRIFAFCWRWGRGLGPSVASAARVQPECGEGSARVCGTVGAVYRQADGRGRTDSGREI